jgi:quinol monooxygenase YgiN
MTIAIFASLLPRPEHLAAVEAELGLMVAATRAEPGCRRYDLFRPADGSPGLQLFEVYDDPAAVEAHRASPHYRAYRARIADWLAAAPVVTVLSPVDARD